MNPALDALTFIINTAMSAYIGAIGIRFILQQVRADYYNPLAQFIVKVTNPVLVPARRFIPGFGGMDIAALIICLLLIFIKFLFFKTVGFQSIPIAGYGLPLATSTPILAVLTIVELIDLFFSIFFFAIIVMAILSWIAPDPSNPVYRMVATIADPVIKPFKKMVPPIAGIDVTPMIAIVALQAIKMVLIPVLLEILV